MVEIAGTGGNRKSLGCSALHCSSVCLLEPHCLSVLFFGFLVRLSKQPETEGALAVLHLAEDLFVVCLFVCLFVNHG